LDVDSRLLSQSHLDSVHDWPDPRDKRKYYCADTAQRRILIALARALFKPLMRMQASGLENLLRQGLVILAANHVTHFDLFLMQFAAPRVICFMSKVE